MVHNEWHGKDATRWHAERDFSARQGFDDWYYQSWTGAGYQDMEYDEDNRRWQGAEPLCQVGRGLLHPDRNCDATLTWISPVDDTVTLSGWTGDGDSGGGNGVTTTILKADTVLWSRTLENGDTRPQRFDLEVPVRAGDRIHFRVNARGDAGWDTTILQPKVHIGPDPCPSGEHANCLMMSITHAVSDDGGRSFDQPPPPHHLVATLPYRWEPDAGHFAMWQPSNIVKHPDENYYYALVQLDRNPHGEAGFQGLCVMRTRTLDKPQSWRAWDGTGFNLRFRDPYRQAVDPARHTCHDVSAEMGGALTYSLTYNSYFEQFIAVGHNIFRDPPGFYYALSADLINWTEMELLMPADLVQNVHGPPYLAYPSLVDHDSHERNFDVTGQRPYLYFTRVNGTNPLDFDLLRVLLEFH